MTAARRRRRPAGGCEALLDGRVGLVRLPGDGADRGEAAGPGRRPVAAAAGQRRPARRPSTACRRRRPRRCRVRRRRAGRRLRPRGHGGRRRARAALCRCRGGCRWSWDPHPRGADPVPGARLVTPNRAEAALFADRLGVPAAEDGGRLAQVGAAPRRWSARWRAGAVAVTLGARGALLSLRRRRAGRRAGAARCTGGDPCGAGDRFAASAALRARPTALVTGEAVTAAVAAAAAYVAAGGASRADRGQADATPAARAGPRPTAVDRVRAAARAAPSWRPVAASTCCTPGTSPRSRAARRLGDCLVVCLNSDALGTPAQGTVAAAGARRGPGPGAGGAGVRRRGGGVRRGHPRRGAGAAPRPTCGPRAATTPAPTLPEAAVLAGVGRPGRRAALPGRPLDHPARADRRAADRRATDRWVAAAGHDLEHLDDIETDVGTETDPDPEREISR